MKIYNIKEKPEYLEEVCSLTIKEWGSSYSSDEELKMRINKKIEQIKSLWNKKDYCKLILIDHDKLIGFISIFPQDGDDRKDLTPWYATMYVKIEYRKRGYSKILNDAILKEAKNRGFDKIYLKTDLINYYEKFGATYIDQLNEKENLYFFNLKEID